MHSRNSPATSAQQPPAAPASDNIKQLRSASQHSSERQFDPGTTLIRIPELEALTGLARATVYKRLKDDPTFPRPVPLSNSNARGAPVGFVLGEVQSWIRGRIAARDGVAA